MRGADLLFFAVVIGIVWFIVASRKKTRSRQETPSTQRAKRDPREPLISISVREEPTARRYSEDASKEATDAWEGWFLEEASDPTPSNAKLRITYTDRNGARTERDIRVIEFDNAAGNRTNGLLLAHCELRGAKRSFRFGQIDRAIDRETGEFVADVQAHLRARWETSPQHSVDEFHGEFSRALEVLLYVACADGRVVAKERAAIMDFCRAHLPDARVTDQDLTRALKQVRRVGVNSFKISVGKLIQEQRAIIPALVHTAERIVGAEKTIHPAEREALDYITRRLSESFRTQNKA